MPVTIGFLQSNFALRSATLRAVQRRPLYKLRLTGSLDRFGLAMAQRLLVNRFDPAERAPVARALEAHSVAIATEIELAAEAGQ